MDDEEIKEDPISDEEMLEPLDEGAMNDFRFDEDNDEDPENSYH